jgi:streptomycin 3"-adenylyltransferase
MCLYGSAVHGGLRPDSDLDLLVVTDGSLSDAHRRKLTRELLRVSGRRATEGPARPVELTVVVRDEVVPWRYPPLRDFQYGEWLRDDYLAGNVPQPVLDPDLAVLLTTVRDRAITLAGGLPSTCSIRFPCRPALGDPGLAAVVDR